MRYKTFSFLILYFLVAITLGMGHPVTPEYVGALGVPKNMFGIFYAMMSLGGFLMAPFWGNLGDHHKRKSIILIGILGYSFAQVLFGTFGNSVSLSFARLLAGMFSIGAVVSAMAYVTENEFSVSNKTMINFTLAVFTLGVSTGYKFGGLVGIYVSQPNLVFYVQALYGTIIALVFYFLTKEEKVNQAKSKKSFLENLANIKLVNTFTKVFLLVGFFVAFAHTNISKFLEVFMEDKLGANPDDIGSFVFLTGIVGLITSLVILPFFLKFRPKNLILSFSFILSGILVYITFNSSDVISSLYRYFLLYMVLKMFFDAYSISIITESNKEQPKGILLGVRQSTVSIANVFAPLIGGAILGETPSLSTYQFLFSLAAFTLIVCGGLLLLINKWYKHD